jgi:SAM-dependent methyltransferase
MFRLTAADPPADQVRRIPMQTAGFRYQRFGPSGLDGDHLYAWIEGGPYTGERPHAHVELTFCTVAQASERLASEPELAAAVQAGAAAYQAQDERAFYAGTVRSLERAYLRGQTPQQGSGFGPDAVAWRQPRWHITECIAAGGTFLDVGCANGLMESVAAWCAERDVAVEPYGVDLSPALAELARRRLPQWAGRIWTGNATARAGLRPLWRG